MNSALQGLKLLFDYALHSLYTMLAFAMLIAVTWSIHWAAGHVQGEFFKKGCELVEQGLFGFGIFLLAVVELALTLLFFRNLLLNFGGREPAPPISLPDMIRASIFSAGRNTRR